MNNGVSFIIGSVIGALTGAGITYVILNKRHEKELNEFLTKVRKEYEEQMDTIVRNVHKDGPDVIRKEREEKLGEIRSFLDEYKSRSLDPEDAELDDNLSYETWVEPEAPGPDPDDPDALYPITESELIEFIENGEDPEELLYSADGDLFMSRDFSEYDSPYIFDGVDIEGCFGKFNPDPSVALFRDPVSKINYRILKSLKTNEDMYECAAQEGLE